MLGVPLKLQLAVLMFTAVAILLYSTACTRCQPRSLLRDVLTVRGPALSTHLSHSIQLTKFPAISNPASSSSSNNNNNRRPSSSSSRSASDGKIHAVEDTRKKKTKKSGDRNLFETQQQQQQQNNNMTRSSSDIKTAPKKKSQQQKQQQQRLPSQDPAPAKLRQVMNEIECRRILHTWIETLLTCSLEFH
jgi:hypothetical protein